MKRFISLLLAIVLLVGLIPAVSMPAAAASAADPDVVTFENWTPGSDLAGVFASGTTMATVSNEKASNSAQSAQLKDISTGSAAILRYETEASSFLDLRFDMLPVVGGVQLRLSNGARSTDNTAYWLGFANKQVGGSYYTFLQYHDGSKWVDVYQFDGTLANKWHSVQIQAAVDGKAAVYVDSQYIGEVLRCGNGYGANVSGTVNSVVFECGAAADTGAHYYLDNLKLVPVYDTVVESFEDYAVGDVPHFPFTDANMATVSDAKAKDGTKSVYMADTVANQVSLLRAMTRKSEALVVEFDMLPTVGGVQFRISNGVRGTANTAFWIKFANKAVSGTYYTFFQYYNGSAWVDAYQFAGTLAGSWHAVRVEASATGNAKVFVDGVFLGEALHCAGSYGTSATSEIDSVIFECGDSTNASWKYYLDNVTLAPLGALDVDFEDVELSGSASALPGYQSDYAACVVADPVNDGDQALYLAGDGSKAAYFEYGYTLCDKYTVEFDAYIENPSNTVTFQVYDGRGGADNTAYFLQFNHAYGLRAFGGSYEDEASQVWTALNEEVRLEAGIWNKIRLEINTLEPNEIVVYLNDALVGNTGIVYRKQEPVNGIHISTGDATQSCYIDDLKTTAASYQETVTPEPVQEGFEQMEDGADLASVLASGTTMATVSTAKAKTGTKSAQLYDIATNSAAIMRMQTIQTAALTLDFDYNPAVGGITFRISNGTRSEPNTAFWLGFANKKGADNAFHTYLQYHNGSAWVDVYEFAGTLANKWSAIHVEAAVNGNAVVSVDGVKIGEAPRTGGTYGSNANNTVDSVIFECGAAAATGGKLYLDNICLAAAGYDVTVKPESAVEDFESVVMVAPIKREDHHAAQVTSDPVYAGGKSLLLCDSTNAKSPYIDYTYQSYNRVTLEFDAYIPTAESTITFQVYDGSRTYKNTAFFLQFHQTAGLRVYTGSYSVLNDSVKLRVGQWNKIRVEIANGVNSEARIYLNDVHVGTTGAYNQKNTVNGFYVFTGANQSCYIDNIKAHTSLEVMGDHILLSGDVTMDALTVEAGKTLDLQGYTLDVKNLACFGNIVDTSEENTGRLIADKLTISELTQMPVYDKANNCYRFFGYTMKNLGVRQNADGTVTFGFAIEFANADAYALMAAGGSGVNVNLDLGWGSNTKTFALDPEFVKEYAHLKTQHPSAPVAMMLTVAGLHTLSSGTKLTVTPSVKAADAVKKNAAMSYVTSGSGTSMGSSLISVQLGNRFTIADNSEKTGLPTNNSIVTEDFSASGGKYGFTQIPNAVYDPDTNRVYINYTRHRDVAVNYPFDSTKVYNVQTLLSAQADAQLQSKYVDMKTVDTMFFTAMTKLRDGRIFAQNYVAYYLTDTSATTYSWIVDSTGTWTRVEGVLTIPKELASSGAQPNTRWFRYGFSRSMVELDDGTLLASMYGPYGAIMVQSQDYGKTWTYRSTIAHSALGLHQPYVNTDGTDITWFEPAVVRCADGSLLCVMRTWRDKPLWQTRSYDDGKTWTTPIPMPGLEGKSIYPHLVLLSNGVLALSTGVPDNTIYFSLDGCGYNWDHSVTTSSGDTTGNSAIAEVGYNASTGTVTLLAFGDTGFNNLSASGVWGRVVKVTRKHVSNPQMYNAIIRADKDKLGLNETLQVRLDAVFNTDSQVITNNCTVQWKSLNPTVATVDATGKVTAKSVGDAKIVAVVSYGGKSVVSNELTVTVRDRNIPIGIENTTVSRWILKVNQMGSVTAVADNYFGQQFVSSIINQEYINGDVNVPKYLKSNITWSYESLKPAVLKVDASTGAFRGMAAGVANLRVTAKVGNRTYTKTITMIVTGDEWVSQSFESATLPSNCTATNLVSVSTKKAYTGTRSVYINDTSDKLAPILTFKIPESKGVVVEFMIYTESNAHAPTFGVGRPKSDGSYNWECNTAYVGLLYNPLTGAQGYQAYNGTAWSNGDRSNKIPINQWNKIRIEIATDKPYRMYVNDVLVAELPLAAANQTLNTIFFSSGGSSYTGDAFYIDDVRYMVLN